MFARLTKRKNDDGTVVEYLQLAHSVREPGSKHPRNKVLLGLGRVDRDGDTLRNLANGILRFLDRADVERAKIELDDEALQLAAGAEGGVAVRGFRSRKFGIQLLVWALWTRLGIHDFFRARDPVRGDRNSRLAFLIVFNRMLDPRSKHALPGWAANEIVCDDADQLTADAFYDVLDVIAEHDEDLQRAAFERMRELVGEGADLALYDTSSAAFEMGETDEDIAEREAAWTTWENGDTSLSPPDVRRPQVVNTPPTRLRGYSRDHRPELPQVTIGLATTERGIPIRCWTRPGNVTDVSTVPDIQQDLAAMGVRDAVFIGDRGMTSKINLDFLESENVRYVVGRKLRDGSEALRVALSTAGPMQPLDDDREFLEIADPEHPHRRLLVVRHRERAKRDAKVRTSLTAAAMARAAKVNASKAPHPRAACDLETTRALARLLKKGEDGQLSIDDVAVEREARLDGITVLTTNTEWAAARVLAAYQGLLRTEDGWRTMKSTESLRPIHHRRSDRILAHITCTALGLGLIRTVEHLTGTTWQQVVRALADVHQVQFQCGTREHRTSTALTDEQRRLFSAVGASSHLRFAREGWTAM